MAARLGNALYWAACILAVSWFALMSYAASITSNNGEGLFWVLGVGGAAVIWLIGRTLRYILSAS